MTEHRSGFSSDILGRLPLREESKGTILFHIVQKLKQEIGKRDGWMVGSVVSANWAMGNPGSIPAPPQTPFVTLHKSLHPFLPWVPISNMVIRALPCPQGVLRIKYIKILRHADATVTRGCVYLKQIRVTTGFSLYPEDHLEATSSLVAGLELTEYSGTLIWI